MKGKWFRFMAVLVLWIVLLTGCGRGELEEVVCWVEEYGPPAVSVDPETAELQRRLARWYNLNLIDASPDESYRMAYASIVTGENGVLWVVELENGWFIPVYGGAEEQLQYGFYHREDSSFPVGSAGENAVLYWLPEMPDAQAWCDRMGLAEGGAFWFHIWDERILYRVVSITDDQPKESFSRRESGCLLVICGTDGTETWIRCIRC